MRGRQERHLGEPRISVGPLHCQLCNRNLTSYTVLMDEIAASDTFCCTSDVAGQHVRDEPHEAEAAWVGRDDVRRIPGQRGMAEAADLGD